MPKYFRHRLEKLLVVDKIVTIHAFEFDKNFNAPGEAHDFWEFVYADRGNLFCSADGRPVALREGEMLFHKPNEFHTLAADGVTAPNVVVVSFECKSEAAGFFAGRKIAPDRQAVKILYEIVNLAKRTFDIPYSDPRLKRLPLLPAPTLGGQQLIKNYLEILLIGLMRALTETESGNSVFLLKDEYGSRLARDATRILTENVENDLSVSDLCRLTAYGRAQLFRAFKRATGRTVMEYYRHLKIERAKQLLREGCAVAEIADRLCFDTPNYFSKTFKRLTGLTPTAYKKRAERL